MLDDIYVCISCHESDKNVTGCKVSWKKHPLKSVKPNENVVCYVCGKRAIRLISCLLFTEYLKNIEAEEKGPFLQRLLKAAAENKVVELKRGQYEGFKGKIFRVHANGYVQIELNTGGSRNILWPEKAENICLGADEDE